MHMHKGLQLVPLPPRLEGPETGFRLGSLRRSHTRMARGDQALELGPLGSAAPGFVLPAGFTPTQHQPHRAVDHPKRMILATSATVKKLPITPATPTCSTRRPTS
jgi:hypothetical protein